MIWKRLTRILGVGLLLGAAACSRKPGAPATPPAPAPPPVAAAAPVPPLSYELRLGKGVYQRYCQTCHGETAAGDGFNAFNLDPRPRDLSDPALQAKKTDVELVDAIRRGGAGVGLSALMPPWGRTLSDAQIRDVILYLRILKRPPAGS